jgi:hypothetical protein
MKDRRTLSLVCGLLIALISVGAFTIGDDGETARMDEKLFPFFERRARLLRLPDNVAAVTADILSTVCK